jgi:prepilin-type N-terminal cleavage/methylation domain-containing protein
VFLLLKNKHTLKTKNDKGFSLVELIVVIAIMAVLVGVIAPQFLGYVGKTKESILKNNTQGFYDFIAVRSVEFSKDDWWGHYVNSGSSEKNKTLNNLIEKELEKHEGEEYSNYISLINPYNNNMGVLNFDRSLAEINEFDLPAAYRPALFMTDNEDYSYEATHTTENIVGTIVAYFKVNGGHDGTTEYIQFYYVNEDGSKSDLVLTW